MEKKLKTCFFFKIAYYTPLPTILNIVDIQNLMLRIVVVGCNKQTFWFYVFFFPSIFVVITLAN